MQQTPSSFSFGSLLQGKRLHTGVDQSEVDELCSSIPSLAHNIHSSIPLLRREQDLSGIYLRLKGVLAFHLQTLTIDSFY